MSAGVPEVSWFLTSPSSIRLTSKVGYFARTIFLSAGLPPSVGVALMYMSGAANLCEEA